MKKGKLGGTLFVLGLILSAVIAIFNTILVQAWAVYVIAFLGLFVGLLNITEKETHSFLVASIAFLLSFQALSSVFTVLTLGWVGIETFFQLMSVYVAPASAVVAIKQLFVIAKD